ncbi:MAG: carboxypeptidase-like regulatory domain-containing protein [Myxococcota bacterium]
MRPLVGLLCAISVVGCSDIVRPVGGTGHGKDAGARSDSGSVELDSAGFDDAAEAADAAASADASSPGLDASTNFDARPAADAAMSMEDAGQSCGSISSVTGRVCSPEARDWVPGATITLTAQDCHGMPMVLTATSGVAGWFEIDAVPPGTWQVNVRAGAFSQTYTVTVPQNGQVVIPSDQLCVRGDTVRVAVVTGFGDHIETLLTNLGIHADTFDGNTNYATGAEPFLSDLTALRRYDLIFIDCGAAVTSYTADLGTHAAQITDNLRQYVMGGGSLYASDWAVTFLARAFPQMVVPELRTVTSVSFPFQTTELAGYAPQTINAPIRDAALAQAVGAQMVSITFPDASGARSANWGLLDLSHTQADVLVEGSATTCAMGTTVCNGATSPGPAVNAPLAVRFKLTPANMQGGNVYYTAFHNIAQTGNGVSDILRWIVFHL